MRVAVAISGGIDSAVTALLMKWKGYSVEGVFMQNWDARIEEGRYCTVESDYLNACRIAEALKIPLRRTNFVREYWQNVFEMTLKGYQMGRTPNPDIACNREIKMGRLFRWARENSFDKLATGHYSKIIPYNNRLWIGQALDLQKDQSYFLADVDHTTLGRIELPIGDIGSKDQVRNIARENHLGFLLNKAESMGMCFVGKRRRFYEFLGSFVASQESEVIEERSNKVIGTCNDFVTIGQTIKIGGLSSKLFCISKKHSRIYASYNRNHPLLRPNSILIKSQFDLEGHTYCDFLRCSIRSSDKIGVSLRCITKLTDNLFKIEGKEQFFAPAPGQIAVIYRRLESGDKIVLGCGEIEENEVANS